MSNKVNRLLTAAAVLTAAVFVAAPAATADDAVCAGYESKHRIMSLGGPNAFAKSVRSPGELLDRLRTHRAEIEALLASKGLGHLYEPIVEAVESGRGLSERDLVRGETFEWMAWRSRGAPRTSSPICFATTRRYDAYEIVVTEEESRAQEAQCAIRASGDENGLSVDATGSSPGVEVKVSGPDGARTVIAPGSGTTWRGAASGAGDYTFTATAKVEGTKTVTTHTFVVPKICLNIAYSSRETREEVGDTVTCSDTATVTVAPPPTVAPPTVAPPVVEPKRDAAWTFRGFALALDPDDDEIFVNRFRPNGVNERSGTTLDGGFGLGLGLERNFTPRFGLEASLLWADLEAMYILDLDELWGMDDDNVSFLAITFGPNFHLTPNSRNDLYIGPFVGWAEIGDATFNTLGETHTANFGDDFVLGAQIGLDIPFGSRPTGLHLGLRYMDFQVGDDAGELDVNPFISEIGFFHRF